MQSDYRWLIFIKQLYPTIDVSGNLRIKQEQLNYCEQALNQLGNDVITDESQVSATDMERKRLLLRECVRERKSASCSAPS